MISRSLLYRVQTSSSLQLRYLKSCLTQYENKDAVAVLKHGWQGGACVYSVFDGDSPDATLLAAVEPEAPWTHDSATDVATLCALRVRFPLKYISLCESVPSLKLVDVWTPVIRHLVRTHPTTTSALRHLVHQCGYLSEEIGQPTTLECTLGLTIHPGPQTPKQNITRSAICPELGWYHVYLDALLLLDPEAHAAWKRFNLEVWKSKATALRDPVTALKTFGKFAAGVDIVVKTGSQELTLTKENDVTTITVGETLVGTLETYFPKEWIDIVPRVVSSDPEEAIRVHLAPAGITTALVEGSVGGLPLHAVHVRRKAFGFAGDVHLGDVHFATYFAPDKKTALQCAVHDVVCRQLPQDFAPVRVDAPQLQGNDKRPKDSTLSLLRSAAQGKVTEMISRLDDGRFEVSVTVDETQLTYKTSEALPQLAMVLNVYAAAIGEKTDFLQRTPFPSIRATNSLETLCRESILFQYGCEFDVVVSYDDKVGWSALAVTKTCDGATEPVEIGKVTECSEDECLRTLFAQVLERMVPDVYKMLPIALRVVPSPTPRGTFIPSPLAPCSLKLLRTGIALVLGYTPREVCTSSGVNQIVTLIDDKGSSLQTYIGAESRLDSLLAVYELLMKESRFASERTRYQVASVSNAKDKRTLRFLVRVKNGLSDSFGLDLSTETTFNPLDGQWTTRMYGVGENEERIFLSRASSSSSEASQYGAIQLVGTAHVRLEGSKNGRLIGEEIYDCETWDLPVSPALEVAASLEESIPAPSGACTTSIVQTLLCAEVKKPVQIKCERKDNRQTCTITADEDVLSTFNDPSIVRAIIGAHLNAVESSRFPGISASYKKRPYLSRRKPSTDLSSPYLQSSVDILQHQMSYHLGLRILNVGTFDDTAKMWSTSLFARGARTEAFLQKASSPSRKESTEIAADLFLTEHFAEHLPAAYKPIVTCARLPPPNLVVPLGVGKYSLDLLRQAVSKAFNKELLEITKLVALDRCTTSIEDQELVTRLTQHTSPSVVFNLIEGYSAILQKPNATGKAALKIFEKLESSHKYQCPPSSDPIGILTYVLKYELGLELRTTSTPVTEGERKKWNVTLRAGSTASPHELVLVLGSDESESVCLRNSAIVALRYHFPLYFTKHKLALPGPLFRPKVTTSNLIR